MACRRVLRAGARDEKADNLRFLFSLASKSLLYKRDKALCGQSLNESTPEASLGEIALYVLQSPVFSGKPAPARSSKINGWRMSIARIEHPVGRKCRAVYVSWHLAIYHDCAHS